MIRDYNDLFVSLHVKPNMSSRCANAQSPCARKLKHFPAHVETIMSNPKTPTYEHLSLLLKL
jgi:hypothetical protein